MSTLFEIKAELAELLPQMCDEETGEINEAVFDAINALEMSKDEKIDGWCYWLKQQRVELEAAKQVMVGVQNRYHAMEDAFNSAKARFVELMNGEKFKSAFNTVYYTTTESVVPDQDFDYTKVDDDFLVYKTPELNKGKIKSAIKLGINVPGVHLEEKTSMVIR